MSRTNQLLATGALTALMAGCATTGDGLPNYRTKEADERTAHTRADANGILRNPDGSVVPVYGDPCSELKRTLAATRPTGSPQRTAGQIAGQVGGAIRGGKDVGERVGGAVLGGLAAIGIQIGGDKLNQSVNEGRVATLEGQCAQQTAYKGWETRLKDHQRLDATWNKSVQTCMAKYKNADPVETLQICKEVAGPRPVFNH